MEVKMIGAILVIVSCSGFGFAMAASHRAEERQLIQFSQILVYLKGELQYRLTPLPLLCTSVGNLGRGALYHVFSELGRKLEQNVSPDVSVALENFLGDRDLVPSVRELMHNLGKTLGRFDLNGQLESLALLQQRCTQIMEQFAKNREDRLRSYQTLGICAGTALIILFV